jgi:NAD(P)H dehydrogenase (quinone)
MAKVLIIYYGGKPSAVRRMAIKIAEGVKEEGSDTILKGVEEANIEDLLSADGIVIGSPSYYGSVPGELKNFFDQTAKLQGKLDGKVGAAFSSSQYLGGGNETTLLSIITTLLFHGMVIQGDSQGYHFGPITLNPTGKEDDIIESDEQQCRRLGQRVARLLKKLG